MKMRKVMVSLLAVACVAGALTACGSSSDTTEETSATEEATEETTEETEETTDADASYSGTISTNGSTSMEEVIGVLSESFMELYPDVSITYDATGSGTGIEAVSNGTCDIGLSSRYLKDEEAEGLTETVLALDGIAIIVNENCGVDDLTVEQIAQIYTGEITNWSEVGGDDLEIACIGREAGSGTRDGFESITETEDLCVLSQELTSTGAVIEAVKSSESAIGYASHASVEGQDGIKAITVEGVECTEENIASGDYVIQRPFCLITNDSAELSDAAQAFFDYMTSSEVNDLISDAGCVPVAE